MGVLACNRRGCDNIMCDRYAVRYGYMCWECFEELENVNSSDFIDISDFMDTEKKDTSSFEEKEARKVYLNTIFPKRE